MSRYARRREPNLPRKQRIELGEVNVPLRALLLGIALLVAALACTRWPAHAANDLLARLPQAAQTLLRCLFYAAVLLMCVAFLVGDSYNPFLYFRF